MGLLLVIPQWDYGVPALGHSTEYNSLYLCLTAMGVDVTLFDYLSREGEVGRERMNAELLDIVRTERPEAVLVSLYTDQILPATLNTIKAQTTSVYYAYDDMWRRDFVDFWAPHFSYVTTSYVRGVAEMSLRGHRNAIYLSLASNHYLFRRKDVAKQYDVSFVGMSHPYRRWLVRWLERSGIHVHVFGTGWKKESIAGTRFRKGRVPAEQLVDIINATRVNLNLTNETSWDARYLLSSPRALLNTFRSRKTFAPVNLRIFEVNACGGFQLVPYMEGLEKRYDIGTELVTYQSPEQLVERVRYYLEREDERQAIADAGYRRTLREHTMERRFEELFARIGATTLLPSPAGQS
jgi:spore maturation protein CgeB